MDFPALISVETAGLVIYFAIIGTVVTGCTSREELFGPPTLLTKILVVVWVLWFVALLLFT